MCLLYFISLSSLTLLFSLLSPFSSQGDATFYGSLVKHIKSLLEEREKCLIDKEWILTEALSGRKLQEGGTFQNVLTRRLDEIIIPIFAKILQFVDQYSNLNLLKQTK